MKYERQVTLTKYPIKLRMSNGKVFAQVIGRHFWRELKNTDFNADIMAEIQKAVA